MVQKLALHELSLRVIALALCAIVVMPVWSVFDYFVDPVNFDTFLALRIACVVVVSLGLLVFIKTGKPVAHYRKLGLLTYLAIIGAILPMCLMTDEKLSYYSGFSVALFAVSITVVWPLRYILIPMTLAMLVLSVAHWHTVTDPKTTVSGIFVMSNVLFFSGLGSWLTYWNYQKRDGLLKELESLSNTDRLTGLYNRRYFDLRLQEEIALAKRNDTATAVLMLDVDHFKKYNDHYGHQQGDECLRQFGDCLRQVVVRGTDFVARYGGEEFVVVMPSTDAAGAEIVASKIITKLGELKIPHEHSPVVPIVTASIGIACCKSIDPENLVALADAALYKAKECGRNRLVVA
jgi:diguanylate cyclase (GGDEF)-like protein